MTFPLARSLTALVTTIALGAVAVMLVLAPGQSPPHPRAVLRAAQTPTAASAATAYGRLPLAFEANGGRTDKSVDFIARGRGYALFLTPRASVLALGSGKRSAVVRAQ